MNSKPRLTRSQIERIAKDNKIEFARLMMILQTETAGSGFLTDGRPKILFERHKFRKHTGGVYDAIAPNLSGPWDKAAYRGGAGEWVRFDKAQKLNREAAVKSTSFGLGQILGENYRAAGCATPQEFVTRNFESEQEQVQLMINFLRANKRLWAAVNRPGSPDFNTVAMLYNGTQYKLNNYHKKLELNYEQYA